MVCQSSGTSEDARSAEARQNIIASGQEQDVSWMMTHLRYFSRREMGWWVVVDLRHGDGRLCCFQKAAAWKEPALTKNSLGGGVIVARDLGAGQQKAPGGLVAACSGQCGSKKPSDNVCWQAGHPPVTCSGGRVQAPMHLLPNLLQWIFILLYSVVSARFKGLPLCKYPFLPRLKISLIVRNTLDGIIMNDESEVGLKTSFTQRECPSSSGEHTGYQASSHPITPHQP